MNLRFLESRNMVPYTGSLPVATPLATGAAAKRSSFTLAAVVRSVALPMVRPNPAELSTRRT